MPNKPNFENGYKWGREKTEETPYYYDLEYKGRIWCDHNLYRLLHSMDEREYKQRNEESRCVVLNKNGLPVKCRLKCSTECPYGHNHPRTGAPISMDEVMEGNSQADFSDGIDDARGYVNQKELEGRLNKALDEFSPKDRALYISIKIEGEKEGSAAERLGVSRNAVHKKIARISKLVEEKLKDFAN